MNSNSKAPKQLKPFAKGHDSRRNLAGRPRNPQCITALLRKLGEENDGERFQKVAEQMWNRALEGDTVFIKEILDRMEGKAIQSTKDLTERNDLVLTIGGRRLKVNNAPVDSNVVDNTEDGMTGNNGASATNSG
jgi:hypothetical protein